MIDLSVVIVVYKNDEDVLRQCLMSVAGSRTVSYEIFVIDNAGERKTERLVREVLPEATVIINGENKGFAAACNQGLKLGRGRYSLLLNPDTIVPPSAFKTMVDHLDQDKEVGIGSSVIRYPDGRLQESIRRFPGLSDQIITLLKLPHLFQRIGAIDRYMMRDVDPMQTQDVDSIMGAFMFIRREVIDKIGYLDERYFIWFEEVDYCKLAVDAGFKVRHYADVEVVHHKGHSFHKVGTARKQAWMRESLRKYMRKHHGLLPWLILWMLTPLFILLGYVAAIFR